MSPEGGEPQGVLGCAARALEAVASSSLASQGKSELLKTPTSARLPGSWPQCHLPSSASSWQVEVTPPTPSTSASQERRSTAQVSGSSAPLSPSCPPPASARGFAAESICQPCAQRGQETLALAWSPGPSTLGSPEEATPGQAGSPGALSRHLSCGYAFSARCTRRGARGPYPTSAHPRRTTGAPLPKQVSPSIPKAVSY